VKHIKKQTGHQARKRFGQNFLQDQGIIDDILAAISPLEDDHMVEIGPGQGAITAPLVDSGAKVDVVELDRDLIPILERKFTGKSNLTIHAADALNFDFTSLVSNGEPLRVIGNLPYNITTPLLFHLLDQAEHISDMCFMLQKEVVERICAQPGTKSYGRLSIMIQYFCEAELLFIVPPEAFDPIPKVDSAIIYLRPLANPRGGEIDVVALNKLVTAAFSQRRKTLSNTLKNIVSSEQILAVGLQPEQRAETVTVEQFVALAKLVSMPS
jgi:16S rRNA (adenine1518-N6/adenine1519-N6)-dimethyltransferase